MKVVYVTSIPEGGPVTHLRSLVPAVAAAGVEPHVVCATERVAASFRDAGVPATVVPLRHKADVAGARRVWPLLAGADVVHTHDRRSGLLVRPAARARGAAVFHTYHGLPHQVVGLVDGRPAEVTGAHAAWLVHGYLAIDSALALLGQVIVPSRALARFLVANRFPAGRLHVVPNGIDLRRTEPAPAHEPLVVGTAAILEHGKGVDVLLEAVARIDAPVRVEIFGDGSLRGALEQQAGALGVDARFHGRVDDVRSRLEGLDVFVLPSRGENLPMALLEAMAAAVPPVATRVGGVPELVVDGESGLLVPVDDADSLADAIAGLARDPERRERLARQAAQRVANEFEAEAVGRRMVSVYAEAIG
ncbi:MAG TPA: glycosyltransferase family 4 protein [Gaiellaceae bacterium]|nr:glycosyltransferase family 4 protein [Gaiellaceae bacterium]